MENLLDAVRAYFEEKNRVWISGDIKHVIRAAKSKGEAGWWKPIGIGIAAKKRSADFRHNKILRTHTKARLKSLEKNASGDKADLVVDELVTWVYHDVEDYNVESRLIRHWQIWKLKDNRWRLDRDAESDERHHGHDTSAPPNHDEESVVDRRTTTGPSCSDIDLFRRAECTAYDRLRVLRYAELWWNGANPQYIRFSDNCTNFISQCLFAGNLKMIGGQNRSSGWWYKFHPTDTQDTWSYSWTTSHALYLHLVNDVKAQSTESARDLKVGDVVFYDWDGTGRFHHTTVVVDFDGNGDPLVNAQTDASYHRHYLYLDSRAWTRNTRYAFVHIPDRIC